MNTIVTVLFDGQKHIPANSRDQFNPEYADKLYRGFKRNTTKPFEMVCISHWPQPYFKEPIRVVPFLFDTRRWTCINEIYRPDLNISNGIFMGLDTCVTGNVDELLAWHHPLAVTAVKKLRLIEGHRKKIALNAVVVFNAEKANWLWGQWLVDRTRFNRKPGLQIKFCDSEMNWLFAKLKAAHMDPVFVTDKFPGYIKSWKVEIQEKMENIGDARLVYFHGQFKPHNTPEMQGYWT